MKIDHKTIVLTGAASGIGRELLFLLAEHSATIMAVDIDEETLQRTCAEIERSYQAREKPCPAHITPYPCDLSGQANVDRLFKTAVKMMKGIDIFIANAGFAYYEKINKPDWRHLEHIYRVNVLNPLYSIGKMQALNGEKPYKVILTASAMAHISVPGYAIYSSTKAALHRFADGYRWQLKDPRKLMLVYPISTHTEFFHTAGKNVPIPWPCQQPRSVAQAILRGIRRDARKVYPSTLFQVVMLLDRFLPMHWLVQKIDQRRMEKWLKESSISQ